MPQQPILDDPYPRSRAFPSWPALISYRAAPASRSQVTNLPRLIKLVSFDYFLSSFYQFKSNSFHVACIMVKRLPVRSLRPPARRLGWRHSWNRNDHHFNSGRASNRWREREREGSTRARAHRRCGLSRCRRLQRQIQPRLALSLSRVGGCDLAAHCAHLPGCASFLVPTGALYIKGQPERNGWFLPLLEIRQTVHPKAAPQSIHFWRLEAIRSRPTPSLRNAQHKDIHQVRRAVIYQLLNYSTEWYVSISYRAPSVKGHRWLLIEILMKFSAQPRKFRS